MLVLHSWMPRRAKKRYKRIPRFLRRSGRRDRYRDGMDRIYKRIENGHIGRHMGAPDGTTYTEFREVA